MKPLCPSAPAPSQSLHHFDELFGVTMPPPALERGLRHSRELSFAWHVERIAERLGEQCWFSHYYRDHRDPGPDHTKMRAYSLAGFWPSGGFVEWRLRNANPLDDHPRRGLSSRRGAPAAPAVGRPRFARRIVPPGPAGRDDVPPVSAPHDGFSHGPSANLTAPS